MPTIPLPMQRLDAGQSAGLSAPGAVTPRSEVESRQGAALGDATAKAGAAIANIAVGLQGQLDEARVKEGYTKLGKFTTTQLEDPKDGYLNKRGADAAGNSRKAAIDAIEKERQAIEKGLDNDRQREDFRSASERFMGGVTSKVYGHEAEQFRAYSADQSEAMADQAAKDAINARLVQAPAGLEGPAAELAAGAKMRAQVEDSTLFEVHTWSQEQAPPGIRRPDGNGEEGATQDPHPPVVVPAPAGQQKEQPRTSDFDLHKNTAIGQAHQFADLNGWAADSPQRAQRVLATTTKIHGGVVDALVKGGRYDEAAAYVAGVNRAEVAPNAYASMQALVRSASDKQVGTRLALQLGEQPEVAYDPEKDGDPEAWLIAQERSKLDTVSRALASVDEQFKAGKIGIEVRDTARSELLSKERVRHEERARYADQMTTEARAWLGRHPFATPQQLPPELLVAARVFGKEGELVAFARHHTIVTDPNAMMQLDQMRDSGELAAMSATQLRVFFRGRMDDQDWSLAQATHERMQGGGKDPQHTYTLGVNDRIEETARVMGLLPRTSGTGQAGAVLPEKTAVYFDFRSRVHDRIRVFEQTALQGKRKASPEEIQKLLDDAVLDKVFVDRWGRDAQKSAFALSRDNPATPEIENDEENDAYVMVDGEMVKLRAIGSGTDLQPGPRRLIVEDLLRSGRSVSEQAIADIWVHEYKKGARK